MYPRRAIVTISVLLFAFSIFSTTVSAQTPTHSASTTPAPTRTKKAATKAKDNDTIRQVIYHCERDVVLPVTYINTASGGAIAVLHVDGKQISMKIAVSASGARYISIDETQGYRWHTKSNYGILSHLEADHTAKETDVLSHCTEKKP